MTDIAPDQPATRDRLVQTAARLFRQHGYDGVGLAQILGESRVPKGSLYHHFPAGKSDLAKAAALWASDGMLAIIDAAFLSAPDGASGISSLCRKLARLFDQWGATGGCPVTTLLHDAPGERVQGDLARDILARWSGAVAAHLVRLGEDPDRAARLAERLMVTLQGAWVMARLERSSDVLNRVPALIL